MKRYKRAWQSHPIPATASESWWTELARTEFFKRVLEELPRMKRSKFSRHTLPVIGDEGKWKRAFQ